MDEIQPIKLIEKYTDKLEPDQIEALPLLASGMSLSKVSKHTGIKLSRIEQWVKSDNAFIAAMVEFRQKREEYHRSMLDQAGIMAWSRIMEYLGDKPQPGDFKTMEIQSGIAKFVISQLSLKTQKSEIVHEVKPQLHVTEDSATIIAQKLKELQDGGDIIDSEYRIALDSIPSNQDKYSGMDVAREVSAYNAENFDADIEEIQSEKSSNYIMHPECKYGVLEYNEDSKKWRCHICGKWTKDLVVHIRTDHKLSPGRYRNMYGLDKDVKFFNSEPQMLTDEELIELENK